MESERYRVCLEFKAELLPPGALGHRVSRFEMLLPKGSAVRNVTDAPDKDTAEVEVYIDSMTPAMALRDVARAVELATATAMSDPSVENIPDIVNARVEHVPAGT